MNDQSLEQALSDLAATAPATAGVDPDVVWQAARRRRRRTTALAAGGLAVALAVTAVGVGFGIGGRGSAPIAASPSPAPSAGPSPSASPAADYAGAGVWWAPPAAAEPDLGWLASRLPRTIDLTDPAPAFEPGAAALALFTVTDADTGQPRRLLLLTATGQVRALSGGHLRAFLDEGGNAAALTPFNGGLSPDGWTLFVAQRDALEVYDLRSGAWRTLATPEWAAEGARWLDATTIWVPDAPGAGSGTTWAPDGTALERDVAWSPPELAPTTDDVAYGVWVDAGEALAGSYFLAGPVTGGPVSNPEGIVARIEGRTAVLALAQADRGKMCCSVVGWLDAGTVAFDSGDRVLAWRVSTGQVFRVSHVSGVAADEIARATWAWQALG
jgi:hypothetical protein